MVVTRSGYDCPEPSSALGRPETSERMPGEGEEELDHKLCFEDLPQEIRAIVFTNYIRDFELFLDCVYIHPREKAIFRDAIFRLNKRLRIESLQIFLLDRPFFTYSLDYKKRMNWFRRWVTAGNTPESMVSVETHLQSLKISVVGTYKMQLPHIYESLSGFSNLRQLVFSGIYRLQTAERMIQMYDLDRLHVAIAKLSLLEEVRFDAGPFVNGRKATAFNMTEFTSWIMSTQGDKVRLERG